MSLINRIALNLVILLIVVLGIHTLTGMPISGSGAILGVILNVAMTVAFHKEKTQ